MYVCVGLLRESCVSNGSCYRVLSRDMRWGQAHAIHSQPLTINEGCERCSRPEAPWCETPPLPRSALDRGVMLVAFACFINVHRALIITYIEVINIMFLEIYILKNKWTSLFSNIIILDSWYSWYTKTRENKTADVLMPFFLGIVALMVISIFIQ